MRKLQEAIGFTFVSTVGILAAAVVMLLLFPNNEGIQNVFQTIGIVSTVIVCLCVVLMGIFKDKKNESKY